MERAQPSLGETLRAARVAQGIDLAGIADTTRVPLRHLQAIEADDHDALPALPYTIGFVKTLARAVGVDQDAAAAHYRAETSKVPHAPTHVPIEAVDESRVPPRWLVAAAVALIVAILAGVWAYGEGMFDSTPTPAPVVAAAEPAPAPAPVVEAPPPAETTDAAATDPNAPADIAATDTAATDGGVVAPEAAPADAADTTPAGTPVSGGPVVITANEEAWFKVYDRATRTSVKMGILKPGERYVVPADRDDLLLWTGKAGALQISVAGKAIPSLGGPQDMVKDVALTPSALLARAGR